MKGRAFFRLGVEGEAGFGCVPGAFGNQRAAFVEFPRKLADYRVIWLLGTGCETGAWATALEDRLEDYALWRKSELGGGTRKPDRSIAVASRCCRSVRDTDNVIDTLRLSKGGHANNWRCDCHPPAETARIIRLGIVPRRPTFTEADRKSCRTGDEPGSLYNQPNPMDGMNRAVENANRGTSNYSICRCPSSVIVPAILSVMAVGKQPATDERALGAVLGPQNPQK